MFRPCCATVRRDNMYWYHEAMIIGALVAGVSAWRVPNAVLWILCGAMSFIVSYLWYQAGLPNSVAFGAFTNAVIIMMLYAFARQQWELRIWNCFHLMLVLDILKLTGVIRSQEVFAVSLEVCNWLALSVIFWTGILDRAARHGLHSHGAVRRFFAPINRSLYKTRKHPPFWEAKN